MEPLGSLTTTKAASRNLAVDPSSTNDRTKESHVSLGVSQQCSLVLIPWFGDRVLSLRGTVRELQRSSSAASFSQQDQPSRTPLSRMKWELLRCASEPRR